MKRESYGEPRASENSSTRSQGMERVEEEKSQSNSRPYRGEPQRGELHRGAPPSGTIPPGLIMVRKVPRADRHPFSISS